MRIELEIVLCCPVIYLLEIWLYVVLSSVDVGVCGE